MYLTAVLAPEQRRIASRAVFATPLVVVRVTSASVLSVVVPATAESTKDVILLFISSPHVPDREPVTGRERPRRGVNAI
jgi:hypothetical protein